MRADDLLEVFHPFTQADMSSTRAFEGIGIGLTIAERMVNLWGGSIHADSAGPGQGSTFRFTASFVVRDVTTQSEVGTGPSSRVAKVLIVDNDSFSSRCIAQTCGLIGAEADQVRYSVTAEHMLRCEFLLFG